MASPSTQIVTVGKTGPAQAVATLTLTGVRTYLLQAAPSSVLSVTLANGAVRDFDLAATATLTATISSGVIALTINQ